eukprot:CAMPEP_0182573040 /NCGR_PEP_ID=MMETSP1324-20130603/18032_1 /TAXON_ID=236786 /ORGANISM="Florenciella sp., Strain RCC1587" /LENGTH=187 /DNA_ID=CAMNT_0024788081 /DNA_START=221 /DNA_END=783 /DNA_ORIENTATION=-
MPPSPATVPPSVRMCRANVDNVAPPTVLESNQNNPRRRAPQCRRAETLNARSSACSSRRFTRRVEDGLEGGACRRWAADAVRTSSTRPIGPENSRSRSEAREAGADATSRRASVTMSELACGGTAALGDTGAVLVMGRGRRVVEHGERATNGGGWGHGGHGKLEQLALHLQRGDTYCPLSFEGFFYR